jgi:3-oxoacid CoA-transferase subunit A
MAGAGKITIAEVEELYPQVLDPNEIHIPGIMVQRIFKEKSLKRIEQRTVRKKLIMSLEKKK